MPYTSAPDPTDTRLTRTVPGIDQNGAVQEMKVVEERPLGNCLNKQEIVTPMTIGDCPEYPAMGYLRNQGMLLQEDKIAAVNCGEEVKTVIVPPVPATDHGGKLRKKTRTSGGAVATVFGAMMAGLRDPDQPPRVEPLEKPTPVDLVSIEGHKHGAQPKTKAALWPEKRPLLALKGTAITAAAAGYQVPGLTVPVLGINDIATLTGRVVTPAGLGA